MTYTLTQILLAMFLGAVIGGGAVVGAALFLIKDNVPPPPW